MMPLGAGSMPLQVPSTPGSTPYPGGCWPLIAHLQAPACRTGNIDNEARVGQRQKRKFNNNIVVERNFAVQKPRQIGI
jgi:hypothetical protein